MPRCDVSVSLNIAYRLGRWVLRAALGFYFARIERFHDERVPATGPILFTSNHPNSVADAFAIGTSVRRKVNFGEPIRAAAFLEGYPERKHDCIRALTGEIEHRIETLMLHLPKLERARVIEAVKRLYLDRLLVGNRVIHEPVPPRVGELLLTQAIARAVEFTCEHHPERATEFITRLDQYERRLKRLNLSDAELESLKLQTDRDPVLFSRSSISCFEDSKERGAGKKETETRGRSLRPRIGIGLRRTSLALFPATGWLIGRSLVWAVPGVLLFPVAVYGWVHRLLPIMIVDWAIQRFAETSTNKTRVTTTALLAGILNFGPWYGLLIALCHAIFGWPVSLLYGLSLPVAGLVAHYYARGAHRFAAALRSTLVMIRAPVAARRLLRMREALIAQIEAARWEVPAQVLTSDPVKSQ